jgi:hypothetical protein
VIDTVVEQSRLLALTAAEIEPIVDACNHLGLSPGGGDVIAWSSERAAAALDDMGQRLSSMLPVDSEPPADGPGSAEGYYLPSQRVWLPIMSDPRLPWELAHRHDGIPWGLDGRLGVIHRLNGSLPPHEVRCGPAKIVIASCMPAGLPSANVDAQRLAVAAALRDAPPRAGLSSEWLDSPSLPELRQRIASDDVILHVVAHGRPGEILWHEQGDPRWLTAERFCDELAGVDVALASFCVCDSAHRRSDGFQALAEAAIRTFARSAIGMRGVLMDRGGAAYAHGLLKPLSALRSVAVDQMATSARKHVALSDGGAHWARPMVLTRDAIPRFGAGAPSPPVQAEEHPAARVGTLSADGQSVPLHAGQLTMIGRSKRADLVVPDRAAAPFAAAIDTSSRTPVVRDQTGEGLLHNGLRVAQAALRHGDELHVGSSALIYREEHEDGI